MVFALIRLAESRGILRELVEAALKANSGNLRLRAVVATLNNQLVVGVKRPSRRQLVAIVIFGIAVILVSRLLSNTSNSNQPAARLDPISFPTMTLVAEIATGIQPTNTIVLSNAAQPTNTSQPPIAILPPPTDTPPPADSASPAGLGVKVPLADQVTISLTDEAFSADGRDYQLGMYHGDCDHTNMIWVFKI